MIKELVNFKKAIISAFLSAFFFSYACYFIFINELIGCIVFIILGMLFLYQLFINGSAVTISKKGVELSFLGKKRHEMQWKDVAELGLIGEKVFTKNPQKTGDKYIYFSPVSLSEEERFSMIVNWPPKKQTIYVEYKQTLLEKAQFYCKKEFEAYNVRDLYPNTETQNKVDAFLNGESTDYSSLEQIQLEDSISKQLQNNKDNKKGFI